MTETNTTEATSKYKFLSPNFFRGTVKGQINSIYKDLSTRPEKLAEYKTALAEGDASLGASITKQQAKKLVEMGIAIPDNVLITSPRRTAKTDSA